MRTGGSSTERESVAILVHGTFAASDKSYGEQWWQLGARFSQQLQRSLPQGVRLNTDSEIFHWSGENSERARSKAAARLLKHVKKLEAAGIDFHLVGHSHGGSVIWHALKLATWNKQTLHGLRSWTTVGTPFLQHRGRSAWNPLNVLAILLALALTVPYLRSVSTISSVFRDGLMGSETRLIARPDRELGYAAVLRAPVIAAAEYMGVRVERMPDGIHLGSFDTRGDRSFATYLLFTREGLVLLGLTAFHIYIGLQLIVWCISPALESRRIRAEGRLEKHAYHRFGSRWLGIWSHDDEAMNGLRATLDLSMQFVGKMTPRERVFVSDTTSVVSRPMYWLTACVYNRLVQPQLDRFVRNMVVRSAQGNDRPTARLIEVTPTPLREVGHDCAALPADLNQRMLESADRHASEFAPKIRRWLGQPSFRTGIESLAREISGRELIHTSYFEHPEIAGLICCNISLGTPAISLPQGQLGLSPELLDWFEVTKRELSKDCGPDPIRLFPVDAEFSQVRVRTHCRAQRPASAVSSRAA